MKRKTESSCFVAIESPIIVLFSFVFFSKVEFAFHWMACGQCVKSRKGRLFRRRGMPFRKRSRSFLSKFYATTGMKRKTEPSCFVVLEKDPIMAPFPFVYF